MSYRPYYETKGGDKNPYGGKKEEVKVVEEVVEEPKEVEDTEEK